MALFPHLRRFPDRLRPARLLRGMRERIFSNAEPSARRSFASKMLRPIFRARSGIAAALSLGLLLSLAPMEAQAFSLFGYHLWGKKKDAGADVIGEPKYYSVSFAPIWGQGNSPFAANDAGQAKKPSETSAQKAAIKIARNSSALYGGRKKPVAGSGGVLARARGDYARILAGFYAAGYYGPAISIKVNGQEAADIPYGTELPDHSKIEISVSSGALYKFNQVSEHTIGAVPAADEQAALKNIKAAYDKAGFAQGAPAKSSAVFAAEDIATGKWRDAGYAKAQVTDKQVTADHKADTVDALINVAPGRQARFGGLTINNVSPHPRMNSHYIEWLTGLKEGEVYSPAALSKANARLSKLQVFKTANLSEAKAIEPNGMLPLTLTLQEQPLHRFGVGGNYSTIDGAGASAYWMHRNLWGHAERLRFDASVSNIAGDRNSSSTDPDDYTYSLGTSFTRPGIITPDTDYVASLKAEREVLDDYRSKGLYFSNGFNHTFSSALSGYLYGQASQVRVTDDTWGKRNFSVFGFLGGLSYDGRDSSSDPTKGYYGEITAQPFYEAHYGNFIGKETAEGRTYYSFDKDNNVILALRGKIGSVSGAPISELPSNMLFFIGGGGSVRGYAYRSIGIYKKDDTTIGGRSMMEGSAELRTWVTDKIGIVGFADAGVVGEKSLPDFDQDTKVGAGLGVRYKTGLGPLRLDVALPLNRHKGDSRYGLYIGIGQSF